MFAKIKKMLFIIPIFVFGLFLSTQTSVFAGDAVLVNGEGYAFVGNQDKANTYYFSNDNLWEFKAEVNLVKDWDTDLRYRVIRPDGTATDWSEKVRYADTKGAFSINYTKLSYNQTVDMSNYKSVAPASTYFVDIEYYGQFLWPWHQEEKDETVKVIVSSSIGSENIPSLNIVRSETNKNKFTVSSMIANGENEGTSIITNIEYFFSAEELALTTEEEFYSNLKNSKLKGTLNIEKSSSVTQDFIVEDTDGQNYLYVLTKTGNGYSNIGKLNLQTGEEQKNPPTDGVGGDPGNSGLFDYDFGELILLVLAIVLVVSCVLIITQKIVDYKKRLY